MLLLFLIRKAEWPPVWEKTVHSVCHSGFGGHIELFMWLERLFCDPSGTRIFRRDQLLTKRIFPLSELVSWVEPFLRGFVTQGPRLKNYRENVTVDPCTIRSSTVSPFYNDIRYNSKIRYNVNLVCTKISGSCIFFINIPMLFFRKT